MDGLIPELAVLALSPELLAQPVSPSVSPPVPPVGAGRSRLRFGDAGEDEEQLCGMWDGSLTLLLLSPGTFP